MVIKTIENFRAFNEIVRKRIIAINYIDCSSKLISIPFRSLRSSLRAYFIRQLRFKEDECREGNAGCGDGAGASNGWRRG